MDFNCWNWELKSPLFSTTWIMNWIREEGMTSKFIHLIVGKRKERRELTLLCPLAYVPLGLSVLSQLVLNTASCCLKTDIQSPKHWDTALPKTFHSHYKHRPFFEMQTFPEHCAFPFPLHKKISAISVLSRAAPLTPLSYLKSWKLRRV